MRVKGSNEVTDASENRLTVFEKFEKTYLLICEKFKPSEVFRTARSQASFQTGTVTRKRVGGPGTEGFTSISDVSTPVYVVYETQKDNSPNGLVSRVKTKKKKK